MTVISMLCLYRLWDSSPELTLSTVIKVSTGDKVHSFTYKTVQWIMMLFHVLLFEYVQYINSQERAVVL